MFVEAVRRLFAYLAFYVKCYKSVINVIRKDTLKDLLEKTFVIKQFKPQHQSVEKGCLGKTGKRQRHKVFSQNTT